MSNPVLFALPFFMAFVSRWHGGGFFKAPKVLKNAVWAGALTVPVVLAYGPLLGFHAAWPALVAFALCFAGKATGHGGGMDLGHSPKEPSNGRDLEKLEFIIFPLFDRIPRYWYDALLLALTGLAAVSGAVIALTPLNPIHGLILAAAGLLKPLGYMIGWKNFPDNKNGAATVTGEVMAGFLVGLALVAVLS